MVALDEALAAIAVPGLEIEPTGFELIIPVMNREDRRRGIDAAVAQWQRRGGSSNYSSELDATLGGHDIARFDGDDLAIAQLVGPGTRADAHQGRGVALRCDDSRAESWVLAARRGMGPPDLVAPGRVHAFGDGFDARYAS